MNTLLDSAYHNRTDLNIAKTNTRDQPAQLQLPESAGRPGPHPLAQLRRSRQLRLWLLWHRRLHRSAAASTATRAISNPPRSSSPTPSALQRSTQATVDENVIRALQKAYAQQQTLQRHRPQIRKRLRTACQRSLKPIIEQRNLGLLDFLDFYDAYKQNVLQVNSIKYNRVQAFEDLNYYTATDLFNSITHEYAHTSRSSPSSSRLPPAATTTKMSSSPANPILSPIPCCIP